MNTEEFCQWVKALRGKHITRKDFCKKYPWHESTVKAYDKNRVPEVDYLFAIHQETGYSFSELLRERLLTGVLNVPAFEFNSALWNVEQGAFNIIVSEDNSMMPVIPEGARLTIDGSATELEAGKVYALKRDGKAIIRRVRVGERGEVILSPDNMSVSPILVGAENGLNMSVLGKVVKVELTL
ncbi:S24 family peptidase [Alteromonas antoniana]|uniref:S24 family peptidase n=1 Tax=Alteromonas antoniana TaxID=2803813 RepID=UPI001C476A1E|nr:S24 family peptidase [Alteromonas antoniana]